MWIKCPALSARRLLPAPPFSTLAGLQVGSKFPEKAGLHLQPKAMPSWRRYATPRDGSHLDPGLEDGGANVCMCDGSVRFLSDTITAETFAALAGGEVVNLD